MKKGIFAQSWQEAMQKHRVYKKGQLEKIGIIKKEMKGGMDKSPAGFLSVIGLYYIQQSKIIFKKIFKDRKGKK
jgi:hypothetical protein